MWKSCLSVYLSVCLLLALFCVQVSASETETVVITGEQLYALLETAQWQAIYAETGNDGLLQEVNLSNEFYYLNSDGDFIICYDDVHTVIHSVFDAVIYFSPVIEYDNTTSISIDTGGLFGYEYKTPAGTYYATVPSSMATGVLASTEGSIDFGIFEPSNDIGSTSVIYQGQSVSFPFARVSSSFSPTSVHEFIVGHFFGLNIMNGDYIANYIRSMYCSVRSISITFETTSGGIGGDSDGSSTGQEELLKQLEIANEYLSKIDDSIQQGTQDIIDNQEENTQDIIDNQDQNAQDIIDNQNQNAQDIIDNDEKLWNDTYNPSDEEVGELQDNITDVTDDLKEKLGLFTFIDDTLSQFFSLLDPDQVSSTNMVFPSLSITVQGESYEFVKQTEYDISSLQETEGFDPLFTALHFFSAAIIYWALIAYLQKVFKRIFASGSGDEQ